MTSGFTGIKYWPIRAGLGLLRSISLLPYRRQLYLSRKIGILLYYLMPRRRHIAACNIRLCFPGLNTQQRNHLVKRNFQSTTMTVFETALTWWATDEKIRPLCHLHGLEHLKSAIASGRSVILLSAHFTCLEIGCRLLLLHQEFAVMYKRHRNPLLESVMSRGREAHCKKAIRQDDIRGFLRALKNKTVCWYAPDQDLGLDRSVFAPFMGVSTATITAPGRFAKMADALVVPYFPSRRDNGEGYDIHILPAMENFPSDDDVENATRINQLIENQIARTPEQYLWTHRRFKTRPPGEADVYAKR
ncbi:MAG: LpxL/LpxP family Kdo(2)-lipid IV(A) lauroyl/palmitoleoyl acyltransferase [Gammaproteobacteria bacterium]|nr:LpxL/LpxP family Kdo(2)-lipid IV(A) lauroyl/palmitoleoyl acyltransferase [Gammaproteobacteria bacterium]MDH5801763.1 LpxL/LpxP family Kdo(2)-lipid IV(A) lauroyl/palmitoleoyl acyltransferase [Gammaproteobacteria bacterium]